MRRFQCSVLCRRIAEPVLRPACPCGNISGSSTIKMLTMTKPGAQIDLLTRAVAEKLKASLGQPVLVSNVPGGSHGSVMATELASSPADGYTLGVSATAAFTYSPFVRTSTGSGISVPHPARAEPERDHLLPDRPEDAEGNFTWARRKARASRICSRARMTATP